MGALPAGFSMTGTINDSTQAYAQTSSGHAERESIVKEFEWAITDLQQVVAELGNRLIPVMRPAPPTPAGNDSPEQVVSTARQRLTDLHKTTGVLRTFLDLIEV